MAYQVKKTEQRIRETLQIVDGDSGTQVDIPVDIYVDGYNLLNRTDSTAIYDWAYYYRNGIGFMAGGRIEF